MANGKNSFGLEVSKTNIANYISSGSLYLGWLKGLSIEEDAGILMHSPGGLNQSIEENGIPKNYNSRGYVLGYDVTEEIDGAEIIEYTFESKFRPSSISLGMAHELFDLDPDSLYLRNLLLDITFSNIGVYFFGEKIISILPFFGTDFLDHVWQLPPSSTYNNELGLAPFAPYLFDNGHISTNTITDWFGTAIKATVSGADLLNDFWATPYDPDHKRPFIEACFSVPEFEDGAMDYQPIVMGWTDRTKSIDLHFAREFITGEHLFTMRIIYGPNESYVEEINVRQYMDTVESKMINCAIRKDDTKFKIYLNNVLVLTLDYDEIGLGPIDYMENVSSGYPQGMWFFGAIENNTYLLTSEQRALFEMAIFQIHTGKAAIGIASHAESDPFPQSIVTAQRTNYPNWQLLDVDPYKTLTYKITINKIEDRVLVEVFEEGVDGAIASWEGLYSLFPPNSIFKNKTVIVLGDLFGVSNSIANFNSLTVSTNRCADRNLNLLTKANLVILKAQFKPSGKISPVLEAYKIRLGE